MKKTIANNGVVLAALSTVWVMALVTACGGGSTGTSSNDLASTVASATESTGTLLCTPSQAQIDACSGLAAGDACSLTFDNETKIVNGTCRTTIDGTAVACAPNPPAPPQALVDACSGKVSGDSCQVNEPDGESHDGVCVTARDGSTIICGRVHTPPQAAIDACSTATAGDSCTMTDREGTRTITGVCSLGPASTGPLACAPLQDLRPSATQACSGLTAGATCTIGERHRRMTGTCITPAAGGEPVCVAACHHIGGHFDGAAGRPPDGHSCPGKP